MDIICPQCKTKLAQLTPPAFCEQCGFKVTEVQDTGFFKSIWRFCFGGHLERRIGVVGVLILLVSLLVQLWRAIPEAVRFIRSH